MDERIYVVFDRVANARSGGLILARNDASVVRSFHDFLSRDEGMRIHAGDYELRRVGLVSDLGEIVPEEPVTVATGAQWQAMNVPTLVQEKSANA